MLISHQKNEINKKGRVSNSVYKTKQTAYLEKQSASLRGPVMICIVRSCTMVPRMEWGLHRSSTRGGNPRLWERRKGQKRKRKSHMLHIYLTYSSVIYKMYPHLHLFKHMFKYGLLIAFCVDNLSIKVYFDIFQSYNSFMSTTWQTL